MHSFASKRARTHTHMHTYKRTWTQTHVIASEHCCHWIIFNEWQFKIISTPLDWMLENVCFMFLLPSGFFRWKIDYFHFKPCEAASICMHFVCEILIHAECWCNILQSENWIPGIEHWEHASRQKKRRRRRCDLYFNDESFHLTSFTINLVHGV